MRRKKISILLASIAILLMAAVAAVFISYRNAMKDQESPLAELSENAGVSIGEVHHTATRDGRTEWRLDAETAEYAPGKQEVTFRKLTVVFYPENDREITLTADRGVLKKETDDIEVSGNVLVSDEGLLLKTERLDYKHDKKVISTSEPVHVKSDSWDLEAESMSMELNTGKTVFEGKVKGLFNNVAL